jgi:hypothetical protein
MKIMRYLKKYDTFKYDKRKEHLNEEFIGALFKNLKNKLSLGFSKMFGSASTVDKIMEEYKKEILQAQFLKTEAIKAFTEYIKSSKEGGEIDKNKITELKNNLDKAVKNYDESIKLIKQKFDIKFNDATKDEKNEKIKNYIQLKKVEMQQDLLAEENKALLADGSLKLEDIDDPDVKKMIEDLNKKMQASQKMVEEQKKILSSNEEKVLGFDIEKAKKMAEENKMYLWEDSPFKDYEFKSGDKIKFFSKTNKSETDAEFLSKSKDDPETHIDVKTEAGNQLSINRGAVISSENYSKEQAEQKSKETQTDEAS